MLPRVSDPSPGHPQSVSPPSLQAAPHGGGGHDTLVPHILSLELWMALRHGAMQRPPQHLPGPSPLHSARPEVKPEWPEHFPANGAHCLHPSLTEENDFIPEQDKDIDLVSKRTFISKLRPQKQKLPLLPLRLCRRRQVRRMLCGKPHSCAAMSYS